jgi:hypothetical protein
LFTLPPAFAIGETAGCGAANDLTIVCAGDEVAVTGFTTSFFDANGNLIRTFAEDNVQVVSQEVLDANGIPTVDANGVPVVRQDVAWILFSIRFGDVTALVPGASTVEVSLNGVLLASATFTGDSAVNNAQDVVIPSVRNGSLNAVDATIVP